MFPQSQFKAGQSRAKKAASLRSVSIISGFYKFMAKLFAESQRIIELRGFKIEKKRTERGEYLLVIMKITEAPKLPGADGFVLIERHIRVDQIYSLPTKNRFMAHWHCTMKYKHPGSGQEKDVHLYYHYGIFQFMTIDGVEVTDNLTGMQFRSYCTEELSLIEHIISLQDKEVDQLKVEYAKAKQKFVGVSLDLIPEATVSANLQRCQELHGQIAKHKEDWSDPELYYYEKLANSIIQARKVAAETAAAKLELEEAPITEALPPAAPAASAKTESEIAAELEQQKQRLAAEKAVLARQVSDLHNEIGKLKDIFAGNDAQLIIDSMPNVEVISDNIFNLSKNKLAEEKSFLKLFAKLFTLPTIDTIFLRMLEAGDIPAARIIYDQASPEIPRDFIYKLFIKFVQETIPIASQERYIALCKFMFEVNEQYRINLSLLSRALFKVAAKELPPDSVFLGYFAQMLNLKNIAIFKELYSQLGLPTVTGLVLGQRVLNLVLMLPLFECSSDVIPYILENNIPCEYLPSTRDHFTFVDNEVKVAGLDKALASSSNQPVGAGEFKHLITSRDGAAANSVLVNASRFPKHHSKVLVPLAQTASNKFLLISFCDLIGPYKTRSMIPSSSPQTFAICTTEAERIAFCKQAEARIYPHTLRLCYAVLVPNELHDTIKKVAAIFESRFKALSDQEITQIYREIITMIAAESAISDARFRSHNLLYTLHIACLYLLNFRTSSRENLKQLQARYKAMITFLESKTPQTMVSGPSVEEHIKAHSTMVTNMQHLIDDIDKTPGAPVKYVFQPS